MMTIDKNDSTCVLEFEKILEKVIEDAFSEPGKEKLQRLPFFMDPEELERELVMVTEMRECLKYDDAFPLESFPNLKIELKKTEVAGAFLRPEAFVSIKYFLTMIRQISGFFLNRPEKYPGLQKLSKRLVPLPELESEINRIIGTSGEILDRASDKLFGLRREIQKKELSVRKRLEGILRDMVSGGYAQEDNLVLRDGRLVIPMKDSSQNRLKGSVVDQSASGATVFMEPFETMESNNEIRKLRIQERNEEEEILRNLTAGIRENKEAIQENLDAASEMDSYSARARFSLRIGGLGGRISRDGSLELIGARHPLLLLKLGQDRVIPLDLKMGIGLVTVVITGPNAGGKTVALKTAGLLALMHQHGLHVPAAEGTRLPIFSGVFADIGDRQSIEQDLSTFSSHIQMIKTILDGTDNRSLVLLDEIGSATDPEEGAALARSILSHLTRRGCFTLATTHMGVLKIFAHQTPGMENASLAFDQKTLRPAYRFQMGIPGSSYAFEIAQRMGLPPLLIGEARSFVGAGRGQLDRLISDLERESHRVHDLLSNAEIHESRLSGLITLYQDKIAQAKEEGEKAKQEILLEAESLLRETNRQAENLIRELRETKAEPETVRKTRNAMAEQKKRIQVQKGKIPEKPKVDVQPGDWVVWQGHGGRAKVLSGTDRKHRLWIQWENMRLQIPVNEVAPLDPQAEMKPGTSFAAYSVDRQVRDEVDLRGMTVDESIEVLDRYLSDAVSAGFSTVRIIHGKGTGVLRREVGKYLKKHALIKNQRIGNWNEGDTGVTIVEMK